MCVFLTRLLRRATFIGRKSTLPLEDVTDGSTRDVIFRPRRLGGWLNDPLRSVPSRVGRIESYRKFVLKRFLDPEKKIIKQIVARRRAEKLLSRDEETYKLGEEYLDRIFQAHAVAPQPSEYINDKINRILEARFNYNPVSQSLKYLGRLEDGSDKMSSMEDGSEHGENGSDKREDDTQDDPLTVGTNGREDALVESANIFEHLSTCNQNAALLSVWKERMDFEQVTHNQCEVPNEFKCKDKDDEYRMLRTRAVVFDKSYALVAKISGSGANYFLEQMLTFSVYKMAQCDVCYGSLLDSKGFIIDTCYVCKNGGEYILVTNGLSKKDVYDYFTSYAIHYRKYGLDIAIVPMMNHTLIGLYGPCSPDVLLDVTNRRDSGGISSLKIQLSSSGDPELPAFMKCFSIKLNAQTAESMNDGMNGHNGSTHGPLNAPYGRHYDHYIQCARISDTGEDGFEFLVPKSIVEEFLGLLLSHKSVHPMGFKTYDIARLESGIIRSDLDLTPECSPMQASLMWNVDIKKIRQKQLFGYKFIGHDLTGGVSKIRVGLICNEMVTRSCTILRGPNRMPIGLITSSVWSPALDMCIAHAYVNSAYAKHNTPVVLSIPKKPPDSISKSVYEKYYRNNIFKTFAKGTIVHLPFLIHNYPIPKEKRGYTGGRQVEFASKRPTKKGVVHDTNGGISKAQNVAHEVNGVVAIQPKEAHKDPREKDGEEVKRTRSRKQLWKDLIARHKRSVGGTLEMALTKWERMNERASMENVENTNTYPWKTISEDSESIVPCWRINIAPNPQMNGKEAIRYYQDLHSGPVPSRHRRFRPPVIES